MFFTTLSMLFPIMYTKMGRKKFMENENRLELLKNITETPGITFADLKRELNLANGLVSYHLNELERRQYIKSIRYMGTRCFYKAGTKIILIDKKIDSIIENIGDNPGTTQSKISAEIKITKPTIKSRIDKLKKNGLISLIKKGSSQKITLTPDGEKKYQTLQQ